VLSGTLELMDVKIYLQRQFTKPIALFILLALSSVSVFAAFEDQYQGYLQTYDNYRQKHGQYLSTRSQYLQFGTLNSKNEALAAVKELLTARADVLTGHLSLLRLKNTDGSFNTQLETYESLLSNHKSRVSTLASLEDSESLSEEIEGQVPGMQVVSRKIVAGIGAGKIEAQKLQFVLLEEEAQTLISQLRASGKEVTVQERWLIDARAKRLLAEQKLSQARNQINGLDESFDTGLESSYNGIQLVLYEANQYLREGLAFMVELSESIKYGNY